GLRTWIWAIAAPALAASIAASAIWRGVTGTLSERPVVSPAPVTAQVMNTSRLGVRLIPSSSVALRSCASCRGMFRLLRIGIDEKRIRHDLSRGQRPLEAGLPHP